MSVIDTGMAVLHLLFAGLWTGGVLFFVAAVFPLARDGEVDAAPLATVTSRLTLLTRLSALVLFVSGGHIAAQRYTVDRLSQSGDGHLVLTMIALWLLLAVLVEFGARKLQAGFDQDKVRQPARDQATVFRLAGVAALLLLVVAGALMA